MDNSNSNLLWYIFVPVIIYSVIRFVNSVRYSLEDCVNDSSVSSLEKNVYKLNDLSLDEKYDEVIALANQMIDNNEINYEVYQYRGEAKLEKPDLTIEEFFDGIEDYKKALELLDLEIEKFPTNADLYYDRAFLKGTLMNRYRDSIEDYQKAIDLKISSYSINDCKSSIKFAQEQIGYSESSIADCNEKIAENSFMDNNDRSFTYYERGMSYFNLGDFDKALEDYKKAIEIDNTENYKWYQHDFESDEEE